MVTHQSCWTQRARELGITLNKVRGALVDGYSIRDGKCTLSRARCERTAVELAREIAVSPHTLRISEVPPMEISDIATITRVTSFKRMRRSSPLIRCLHAVQRSQVGDLYAITDQRETRLVDVIASNPTIIVSQNQQGNQLFAFKATLDAVSSKQVMSFLLTRSSRSTPDRNPDIFCRSFCSSSTRARLVSRRPRRRIRTTASCNESSPVLLCNSPACLFLLSV